MPRRDDAIVAWHEVPGSATREDKVRMGMVLAGGIQPGFIPRTPTQAGSLCYIALRSVERFVENAS